MNEFDENFDELPEEPLELDDIESEDDDTPAKRELLTIRLLKKAIQEAEGNKNDFILASFAENVLPNMIRQLVGATAKGGQFTENRKAEGKNVERSRHDQSFISHLLNGLFPTYRLLKKLKLPEIGTNRVKRQCGDTEVRLFIASYILHDFDKFPDYPTWLVAHDSEGKFKERNWKDDPPHKSDAPNFGREYVRQKIQEFGLDCLLGEDWEIHTDDIVWLSHNAGVKWDSDRGLEIRGLREGRLDSRVRGVICDLVRLSDLFASIVKHPFDVESDGKSDKLPELLNDLSHGQLKFSYHALSDNRGVLTNILNNALIEAHLQPYYTPLLYLPDGVVYLATADAPAINVEDIPDRVIAKIKSLSANQLSKRQTGFSRDGKGLKFADYYWLFFRINELMKVSIDAARRILPDSKTASAGKRSESLQEFQKKRELPKEIDVVFGNKILIDRLAEFGDILCRGIWGKWRDRATNHQKQLPKAARKAIPDLDLTQNLAEYLGLSEEIPALKTIQTLKKTGVFL
jgi:CRISPR-associated protein Csc3